jgi:ADP-dependent NAD(P)H-hydrate dehydratase / NAD(P)H-hydrate epimerase
MKILSAKEIREADAFTIENEPVSSIDLMERAARACTEEIKNLVKKSQPVYIFCGPGNNGGDGLAIARQLYDEGYDVEASLLDFSENYSENFKLNLQRLAERQIKPLKLSEHPFPALPEKALLIDAIFGTGLTRPVEGKFAEVIQEINRAALLGHPVISIDLPSGLFDSDNSNNIKENIIKAWLTLTFQAPKLSFMFAENAPYVGDFRILDIGLSQEFLQKVFTPFFFLDFNMAAPLLKQRNKFSHKGTFGHALMIAGALGKMGAAVLASKACLRSGPGLLTSHIPACGKEILQIAAPEAMASFDRDENIVSELRKTDKYSAIGIGPGIGMAKDTQNVVKMLIQNATQPLVLDADALNILSENKTWLSFLPPDTILTPHPTEFERLAGSTSTAFDRLQMAREFAKRYRVVVVLKGAHTAICAPDGMAYFNSSGNPGMATGGSGDVLTGIITGLLAQKYAPLEAAALGVFVHGLAGDIAAEKKGKTAIIAGDLIECLPKAFKILENPFQS